MDLNNSKTTLYINTSEKDHASIGLWRENMWVIWKEWSGQGRHSEKLLSEIENITATHHVSSNDVAQILVHTGPGSFTGIRVGVVTANAIGYALSIPVTGVTQFDLFEIELLQTLNEQKKSSQSRVRIIIPSIQDLVYMTTYHMQDNLLVKGESCNLRLQHIKPEEWSGEVIAAQDTKAINKIVQGKNIAFIKLSQSEQICVQEFIQKKMRKTEKISSYSLANHVARPFYVANPNIG
jgi:tRNA threonylcarbamoyl adenosine modification protein YeaZ